ncbi:hypothetical protein NKH77_09595 [Streptomyces sp. M19]
MLTTVDKKLDDGIQFYASYMINGKHFDQTNTDAVCGAEQSVFPMDRAVIRDFIEWYLDRIRQDGRGSAPKRADFAYRKARTPRRSADAVHPSRSADAARRRPRPRVVGRPAAKPIRTGRVRSAPPGPVRDRRLTNQENHGAGPS